MSIPKSDPEALKELGVEPPRHVAIIMDGNGRWAQARRKPRVEGHRAGAKTVRMVAEESRKLGIKHLTLYAFSTENWGRPKEEVGALMKLFARYLKSEEKLLLDNDIRLRSIGDRSKLPDTVKELLEQIEEKTAQCSSMDLVLALSYGSRDEITRAVAKISEDSASAKISPSDVNQDLISSYLDTSELSDPELLIRTSGEFRISNFLLWQLAYAEFVITQEHWPEFNKDTYYRCLREFAGRKRRFGLTGEQFAETERAQGGQ